MPEGNLLEHVRGIAFEVLMNLIYTKDLKTSCPVKNL
jgi:hypothetical protein